MRYKHLKLVMDIAMTILFVLMFKKNVLGLSFHEIGGVAVCALFIVHTVMNRAWVVAVSRNLFSKKTPAKVRIRYAVDVLLLLDVFAILFTGLGISKKVFKIIAFLLGWAIPIHMLLGGIALVLVGIHVGLHWGWIKGTAFAGLKGKKRTVMKAFGCVLLAAFLCGGAYSFIRSDFKNWMTRPFASGSQVERQIPPDAAPGQSGARQGGRPQQPITAGNVAKVFLTFLSMMILISTVTASAERLVGAGRTNNVPARKQTY